MSVRNAVAQRDAAPAAPSPGQVIRQQLDAYRPVIAKLLKGTGITEETYVAQIANACRAVPDLWNCEPESLLGAALKAAQLGLAPNDARNLCWILPYKDNRRGGRMFAQFQLGYGGVLELARRAVPGLRFDGRAVFPNDEFDVDFGAEQPLKHRPAVVRGMGRGGDAFAWYVVARFPDGNVQVHVLDRDGVEYHRGFSKQPDGQMWKRSYDAAALKSVVLDMRRWLPSSAQLTAAFASDEQVVDVRSIDADADVIDVADDPPAEVPPPAAAPAGELMSAAQSKALHVLLKSKHNATRDARFPALAALLGRDVTTTSDITKDEASTAIDALNQLPDHQPAPAGDDPGPAEPAPPPTQAPADGQSADINDSDLVSVKARLAAIGLKQSDLVEAARDIATKLQITPPHSVPTALAHDDLRTGVLAWLDRNEQERQQ